MIIELFYYFAIKLNQKDVGLVSISSRIECLQRIRKERTPGRTAEFKHSTDIPPTRVNLGFWETTHLPLL